MTDRVEERVEERWTIYVCPACGSDWGVRNDYFPFLCTACRSEYVREGHKGKREVEAVPESRALRAEQEAERLRNLLERAWRHGPQMVGEEIRDALSHDPEERRSD